MKTKAIALLLISGVTLVACGGAVERLRPGSYGLPLKSERLTFEGYDFRARTRRATDDRRVFTVELRNAQRSTAGAYAAAQYEATKYCLGIFGASEHILEADPETPEADLPVDDRGSWVVTGRCTARA